MSSSNSHADHPRARIAGRDCRRGFVVAADMTSDFDAYVSRLHDELEEDPLDAARGILNGIGAGLILWALIGAAFAAVLGRMG